MKSSFIFADFPIEYQDIMLDLLNTHEQSLLNITSTITNHDKTIINNVNILPFVVLSVLSLTCGLPLGGLFRVLSFSTSSLMCTYFTSHQMKFPGRSTSFKWIKKLSLLTNHSINSLAGVFQEEFYQHIGDRARALMKTQYDTTRQRITPIKEAYLGLAPPSEIFPNVNIKERGILLPFFHFRLFARAQRKSSMAEMIGKLHQADNDQTHLTFRDAAKFGFLGKVPGIQKCYRSFRKVEAIVLEWSTELDKKLIEKEILQLTDTSVDVTNVPVDKRDTTGSIGTGSRGHFTGHKSSLICGVNCMPFGHVLASGRVADSTLFSATFQPVVSLAQATGKDMWVTTTDAGYCDPAIVQEIELANVIAVGDLNPKNSVLLKKLKDKTHELAKYSRLAFYSLPFEERKAWIKEVDQFSQQYGLQVPLVIKRKELTRILHKYANRARRNGLTYAQQQKEKRLRRELMNIRREIRLYGTKAEQIVGCSTFAHKTIEWFLAYAIRGQNEGINGILKKRGDLIGDGQHQSWLFEHNVIKNRIDVDIISLKVSGLIYSMILGTPLHCMRALHNWRKIKEVI